VILSRFAALSVSLILKVSPFQNAVRKHQKVETRRWYHHADVLGLLVWQDMPCCADSTFPAQVTNIGARRPPNTPG